MPPPRLRKLAPFAGCPPPSIFPVRVVRPSDVIVPALWGGMAAFLLGALVATELGTAAGAAIGGVVWALVLAWAARRPLRRLRVARQALPERSRSWLREHVQLYNTVSDADRTRFERDVLWALSELRFEGAGGVEPTDDLQLAVAAGAALLLHGRPDWDLPTNRTILFVPDTFDAAYGDEEPGVYDGMVHAQGPVVLSARAVRRGWAHDDGSNVVLHELAHLFDITGEGADGLPSFLDPRSADAWIELMSNEMRRAQRGDGVLRAYAGTAPAELFAVATEQFFERPARLRRRHPELFEAFEAFYNLTPPDEDEHASEESLMARRWQS